MASSQLRSAKVEPYIGVGDAADVGEKVLVDVLRAIVVFIVVT